MNLMARQHRVLLGGLAVALMVVFSKPIRALLEMAQDVERSSGPALMPALLILAGVFLYHLQASGRRPGRRRGSSEADALQAGTRATEMEGLVTFGQALGRSLDLEIIRDVVAQHLPKPPGTENAWVLLRAAGERQALVGTARDTRRDIERARARVAAQAMISDAAWSSETSVSGGHLCMAMTAGGHPSACSACRTRRGRSRRRPRACWRWPARCSRSRSATRSCFTICARTACATA